MVVKNQGVPRRARHAEAGTTTRVQRASAQVFKGTVTIVRRVGVGGDPRVMPVPKFDCSPDRTRSIYLPLDDAQILELARFVNGKKIEVEGGTFQNTMAAIQELLNQFNVRGVTAFSTATPDSLTLGPDPCSMPGHHWTGTGCTPSSGGRSSSSPSQPVSPTAALGAPTPDAAHDVDVAAAASGHMYTLRKGEPATSIFGKVFSDRSTFVFGYCISVQFD